LPSDHVRGKGATYSAALVVVVLAWLAVVASGHDVDVDVGRRATDVRRGHSEGGHGGDGQDDGGELHDVEVNVGIVFCCLVWVCLKGLKVEKLSRS
jgi:hypothetical protein